MLNRKTICFCAAVTGCVAMAVAVPLDMPTLSVLGFAAAYFAYKGTA